MRKVTSLQQVENGINSKSEFFHYIKGRKYNLSFIELLGMSLLEIIKMIKEEKLFYQTDE